MRALGAAPLRKSFEASGPAKSTKVPNIAGSRVTTLDGARFMLSSAKRIVRGSKAMWRCQWPRGRFLLGLQDMESQPYECYIIAASLGAVARSNKAT